MTQRDKKGLGRLGTRMNGKQKGSYQTGSSLTSRLGGLGAATKVCRQGGSEDFERRHAKLGERRQGEDSMISRQVSSWCIYIQSTWILRVAVQRSKFTNQVV